MGPEEYLKLLSFIHTNNGWKHTIGKKEKGDKRPLIKYVDCNFDTRDGIIFNITLRGTFDKRNFKIGSDEELQALYTFLKGEED